MGTNTLNNRTDGEVVDQTFFNEIHEALNGDLVPRNTSGAPNDNVQACGTSTFRFSQVFGVLLKFGSVAGNLQIEEASGDIVFRRNGTEVGRFTANGLDGTDIVSGSVDTTQLADASVTTNKIDTQAVTTVKIADVNVTTAKIADLNVTEGKIANNAVTTNKIAAGNITTILLDNDAVTTAKIADDNVTLAKLAPSGLKTANQTSDPFNIGTSTTQIIATIVLSGERTDRPFLYAWQTQENTTLANCGCTTTGSQCVFDVNFKVAGTIVSSQRYVSTGNSNFAPSQFFFIDASPTATANVALELVTDANTSLTIVNSRLIGYQL